VPRSSSSPRDGARAGALRASLLLALATTAACAPASFTAVGGFGPNPGWLAMFEHVPAPMPADPMPLLVVLHGCTQDHGFADDAGFVDLADARGFAIVAPQQRAWNNSEGCFDWFLDGDTTRDEGEVASIANMVAAEADRVPIDATRVYVTGVSAGAAMTSALLATYPDVFAGGAIAAGAPYGCASTIGDTAACLAGTADHTQAEWAARVTDASTWDGPWPRVLVLHGDDDAVVAPANADALVLQWTGVAGIAAEPVATETFATTRGDAVVSRFGDDEVESIRYAGLGHELPVDPDAGCGRAGPFLPDVDDCTATRVADFLGL
jgi:poly(hydroxyalkanoate) depolymerase family esterase